MMYLCCCGDNLLHSGQMLTSTIQACQWGLVSRTLSSEEPPVLRFFLNPTSWQNPYTNSYSCSKDKGDAKGKSYEFKSGLSFTRLSPTRKTLFRGSGLARPAFRPSGLQDATKMDRQPSTGGFALLFKINQVTKVEDEVKSIGFRVRQNSVQMQA